MGHTAPRGGFCLTVSGLVFADAPTPRVLVHRHKRYPLLLLPGGHVEPDEHPWAAVLRELREETGIAASQLRALQALELDPGSGELPAPVALDVHPVDSGWSHTDLAFAFMLTGEPQFTPAEGESLDLRWIAVAELGAQEEVPQRVAALAVRLEQQVKTWAQLPAESFG
jgi:8-oxo-dGTP diphosphatase